MKHYSRALGALVVAAAVSAPQLASAEDLVFEDPSGDDNGPGTYTYPTAAEYTRGSFDLRKLEIIDKGSKIELRVTLGARIEDPWDSKAWPEPGNGFSLQMVQVYLDTVPGEGKGHTAALPGINASFAAADAWDRVVVVSPQPKGRLKSEVAMKAAAVKDAVVVPVKVVARGKTLVATVKKKDLGGSPTKAWGIQAVVQSNEGYPSKDDLLTRRVNEYPGKHRFGGGNDWDCDPHVLDILAGVGVGEASEVDAQKSALAYECGDEGKVVKQATLPMVSRP
jgi:carbohydrate-binding DOMON domain-containing protein